MSYQAFTNDSLTMMYEGIRGALAADDGLSGLGEDPHIESRHSAKGNNRSATRGPRSAFNRRGRPRAGVTIIE
jgi:hypothetical protein